MIQTRRLNYCMILHVYKNITDKLDTEKFMKAFVDSHIDRRKRIAVTIKFIVIITIFNKAMFLYQQHNIFYIFPNSTYI